MGITAVEAARIANEHGLSLSDAVALQRLANTTEEAEHLAGQFAPEDDTPADKSNARIRSAVKSRRLQPGEDPNSFIRKARR